MMPPFNEALDDLIDKYVLAEEGMDEIISALELKLMALKEEHPSDDEELDL